MACDLCKKEFFNEDYLRLHKANKHKDVTATLTPPPPASISSIGSTLSKSPSSSSLLAISSSNIAAAAQSNPTTATVAVKPLSSQQAQQQQSSQVVVPPGVSSLDAGSDQKAADLMSAQLTNFLSSSASKQLYQNLNKQQQQLASQFDLFGGNAVAAAAAAAAAAGIPTPAIFGIMDSYFAAKMADRVTCDICNKQVGFNR